MSDESDNGNGFNMSYVTEKCQECIYEDGCGGYHSMTSGLLSSPRHPDFYPSTQDCIYTISQKNNTYIKMRIKNLDVDCAQDFLEIRDGPSAASPQLVRYCGNITNITEYITTTQNLIWIR